MSVRIILVVVFLFPATLYAAGMTNEKGSEQNKTVEDTDIFEFLAMFDQKDSVYIESEMDDVKQKVKQGESHTKVTKSESNEK